MNSTHRVVFWPVEILEVRPTPFYRPISPPFGIDLFRVALPIMSVILFYQFLFLPSRYTQRI